MRIGIDARLWNETGVGRYIRNLVYNLLVLDKKNEYVLFVRSTDSERIKNQEVGIKENWKIVSTDIHWHTFEEQIKLPQLLYREHLDLVHFPYFSVPIFYARPFVVTIHDLIIFHHPTGKASTLPLPVYYLKRFGYQRVMAHAVTHAKKIFVPLHTVEGDLMERLHVPKERIAVTYEGVDANINAKGIEQRVKGIYDYKRYFLYVGNAYPHKNLERLIRAFSKVKAQSKKDLQLFLVGKDDYFYQRLQRFVEEKNCQGIVFLHDVDDQHLSSLYAHALALVSASFMEGFGLPPLEALAHHCPVLVSDIPAFHEVLGDAAVYFDPKNITDIANKMNQLLQSQGKYDTSKRELASNRLALFSWKTMADETLDVYNKC